MKSSLQSFTHYICSERLAYMLTFTSVEYFNYFSLFNITRI